MPLLRELFADVAELPDSDRILGDVLLAEPANPILTKSFDESKHPRGHADNPGQFGSGGGVQEPAVSSQESAKPTAPAPPPETPSPEKPSPANTPAAKLAAVVGSAITAALKAPGALWDRVRGAAAHALDAYKAGGVKGVARKSVTAARDAAMTKYRFVENRYGRKTAILMVGGYLAAYATYATAAAVGGPAGLAMATACIPCPTGMMLGCAEGVKGLAKIARKTLGKKSLDLGNLMPHEMLALVKEFIADVAKASGEDLPPLTDAELWSAIAELAGGEEDGV